jgi:hypothetical protein
MGLRGDAGVEPSVCTGSRPVGGRGLETFHGCRNSRGESEAHFDTKVGHLMLPQASKGSRPHTNWRSYDQVNYVGADLAFLEIGKRVNMCTQFPRYRQFLS